jgi:hypothetical protein
MQYFLIAVLAALLLAGSMPGSELGRDECVPVARLPQGVGAAADKERCACRNRIRADRVTDLLP